ncbi:hypothetical protein TNCV_315611 [Trichonephila clavipes]|nr:hypothetical protein TNCV_315611 [Trichonephila clavipes]
MESRWTVETILKSTNNVVRISEQGRPKDAIPLEYRYLVVNTRLHRDMSVKEFAKDFAAAIGRTIYKQTICRPLAEKAFYARQPVVSVPLNPSQK